MPAWLVSRKSQRRFLRSSSSRRLPRGWAYLTSMDFPRISSGLESAASTAASLSKVTKPKPRGRPVSLSIIKVASITRPNCMKNCLKSCSFASWLTPPTKILLVFSCSSRGIARFGSIFCASLAHNFFSVRQIYQPKTHNLSIQIMLFDHHSVDRLGVSESQESEAPRTTCGAIPHDRTFLHISELGEVVSQRF